MADHKAAARSLLTHPEPKLNQRSGQFCGGLMFSDDPLTEKQERWLSDLLRKHDLLPLANGGQA
ncbi:MAG TPA: hypothetical protein VF592_05730 [Sphingomonas sp.]|jgi:hypothetical protein|uniref:hypothetical protein n=1 Tax=Sphingomonas sp. TaxID=28214 RepID=UPI002ED99DEB